MDTKLFALFIGQSSSGKSAAAASLPKPLLECDFDLRGNGIRNAIAQGWLNGDGIDFKEFDPFGGYIPVQEFLNMKYISVKSRQFQEKSIDIGSLTSLVRLLDLTSLNNQKGGLNIAGLALTGPADYKFESQAAHKIFDFLRTFPCNVTVSAHIVDKYGKDPSATNEYAPQIVVGEKLTITANLGANILAMFNDVYKFSKRIINEEDRYFVEFTSEIARNSFGIPPGLFDITRKEFWPFFNDLVASIKDGTFKKPPKGGISGGNTLVI